MKISSIKTVYDFMRYCRMPLSCQRTIRDMKVGDTFYLGQYREKIHDNDEGSFVAEVWIEKERGIYKFYGTWTIPTKTQRPLIMTFGDFNISKGGIIKFGKEGAGVKEFAIISRYLDKVVRKMSLDELRRYFSADTSPLFRGVWVDKRFIDRRKHIKYDENKSLHWYRLDYSNYAPTHQLQAVVTAAIALKQINQDR
ncbi:hypothetical protein [Enterobacter asburiae]|uniref:hypothetical protein n=1 Tax=Enterobacter asburiae TaxID=61645 RepID=UPI0021D10ABB|nr:hypothetical protein [Enterobacter asburiae]MCU6244020.1 hypothetical protein [Enterobacter asburiae]